jgi:tRNA-splicing ligase RtcB (3'-phosphate/5'-hydroxy nucleic acid ligase)
MPPTEVAQKLLVWGADAIEPETLRQAEKAARLPFVPNHVALMPDAHVGIGATVGSVIPTEGAIIPAAVGVDIGCGMAALETGLSASQLPDDLRPLLQEIEQAVPAGLGKGQNTDGTGGDNMGVPAELKDHAAYRNMKQGLRAVAENQLCTLGSGNHFIEISLDESDKVWIVLHSGSRGVGNKLAKEHIRIAKGLMKDWFINLEDPDLAYLVEGAPQFEAYIQDMLWSQDYAAQNRRAMLDKVFGVLRSHVPIAKFKELINCHHNFTRKEHHMGRDVWLTRKGAISAREGQRGIIPGSMGTSTFLVQGSGNTASYTSCSHGAGRRFSRSKARKELTVEDFEKTMIGKVWLDKRADQLLDEAPEAYKDINEVMAAQSDLVTVTHELRQVLNYKGT